MLSINLNSLDLEVEAGPERGRRYKVESGGARIGRDPSNDFVVRDPSLSRFHCRIYLAADGQARLADLGSTNTTEVNGAPIQDVALMPGDRIAIGDTILRVLGAAPKPAAVIATETTSAPSPAAELHAAPEVPDLFKKSTAASDAIVRRHVSKSLWLMVAIILVVAVVLLLFKFGLFDLHQRVATKGATLSGLELQYEKVQATATNIFRYEMSLTGNLLSARIDNLENGRHVTRDKKLDPQTLEPLINRLDNSGFFALQNDYQGMATDIMDSWDLAISLGPRTKRVRVINRLEPEAFAKARALVEDFGKNELGIAALSLPPEQLIEMARDAMLQGKKFSEELDVNFGNLYKAIKAYQAAEVYLETIDPKPDFFEQVHGGRKNAEGELQRRYEDRAFRAERAIKLSDWADAKKQLLIILDMIPDREDERNKQAKVELLDVEPHLKR